MGYKEGEALGKPGQISDSIKRGGDIKDEMFKVQDSAAQVESKYSDFAQRQMVSCDLYSL